MRIPKIERVEIRWNHGLGNSPQWIIHVDDAWEFPSPYENWPHRSIHSEDRGNLYYAENGCWAHFVFDDTREGETGHTHLRGALTGNLLLEDGSKKLVASGWTSRAGAVNNWLPEEDHLVDTTLVGGHKYTMGRAGLYLKVKELRKHVPEGVYIVLVKDQDITYYPSCDPNKVAKPNLKRGQDEHPESTYYR